MQECDACGLIFGGTEVCPSCGSRNSHEAKVVDASENPMPAGELPGLEQLVVSMDGVESLVLENQSGALKTSLPFSIGGSTGGQTTLPFGVGSPSRGAEEKSQLEFTEDNNIASGSENETVNEKIVEPEPLADNESKASIEDDEVILVARAISVSEPVSINVTQSAEDVPVEIENDGSEDTTDSSEDHIFSPGNVVSTTDDGEIIHQEDIVYHDFGDKMQVSEVVVDFDSFVDPSTSAVSFDPSVMEGTEPELMPARALAINGLNDTRLQEQAHIGFAALAQANWKEAADCFRIICEAEPQNSAALNNFGLSLLQQALLIQEERPSQSPAEEPHFEASVLALRQAAKSSQNDVSIICNLATALSSCHRHDSAVKFYDVALKFDQNDIPSMNGKAVSCIGLREYDMATDILRTASTLDSTNEIVSGNLHRISPMG
tara:strand:- start:238 stop:1539 length:1302 start_codon:yes stop_codon:yes gene_type:complete